MVETLVFKNIIRLFNNLILLLFKRDYPWGIFNRPLFGLPALCQHKPDIEETLLFKNTNGLFRNLLLLFTTNNRTIVKTSGVTKI